MPKKNLPPEEPTDKEPAPDQRELLSRIWAGYAGMASPDPSEAERANAARQRAEVEFARAQTERADYLQRQRADLQRRSAEEDLKRAEAVRDHYAREVARFTREANRFSRGLGSRPRTRLTIAHGDFLCDSPGATIGIVRRTGKTRKRTALLVAAFEEFLTRGDPVPQKALASSADWILRKIVSNGQRRPPPATLASQFRLCYGLTPRKVLRALIQLPTVPERAAFLAGLRKTVK